jgi:hypothetical protein
LRISEPPEFHEILARSSDCHLPLNLIWNEFLHSSLQVLSKWGVPRRHRIPWIWQQQCTSFPRSIRFSELAENSII